VRDRSQVALVSKPPLFPPLFVLAARAALVAILLINLYYVFGAGGFSYGGRSFSFKREHDRQLFAIDERRAFSVSGGKYPSASIVKYGDGFPLFRACGACEPRGSIFNLPRFKKGDWVYTDMPWIKGPAAYNLRTEELVTLKVPAPANHKIDPEDVPFYAEHGLTFDESRKLDLETIAETYKPVSTINEMCVILQVAGFIVVAIIGLIALILLPFGLRKRRNA